MKSSIFDNNVVSSTTSSREQQKREQQQQRRRRRRQRPATQQQSLTSNSIGNNNTASCSLTSLSMQQQQQQQQQQPAVVVLGASFSSVSSSCDEEYKRRPRRNNNVFAVSTIRVILLLLGSCMFLLTAVLPPVMNYRITLPPQKPPHVLHPNSGMQQQQRQQQQQQQQQQRKEEKQQEQLEEERVARRTLEIHKRSSSSSKGIGTTGPASPTSTRRNVSSAIEDKNEEPPLTTPNGTTVMKTMMRYYENNHNRNNHKHSLLLVPTWLRNHAAWQRKQLETLNRNNWTLKRYLVLRCLEQDGPCGGASDRLQSIPIVLYFAAITKRILFIHWTKPAPLEEFLQPPTGGLDWRIPSWLLPEMNLPATKMLFVAGKFNETAWNGKPINVKLIRHERMETHVQLMEESRMELLQSNSTTVLSIMFRVPDLAHGMYNLWRNNYTATSINTSEGGAAVAAKKTNHDHPTIETSYSHIWRFMFQPSPAIQDRIDSALREMELKPGKYVAVHARVRYNRITNETAVQETVQNSIDRAVRQAVKKRKRQPGEKRQQRREMQQQQQLPIYFASDSVFATDMAVQYGKKVPVPIKTRRPPPPVMSSDNNSTTTTTSIIPHLDRGYDFLADNDCSWKTVPVQDYYDAFVDLHLLANAQCVQYGAGKYGSWASLIAKGNNHHDDDEDDSSSLQRKWHRCRSSSYLT